MNSEKKDSLRIFLPDANEESIDLDKIPDEKTIQFLIESAMQASRQYWTKMNVWLAINFVFLGLLAKMVIDQNNWTIGNTIIGLFATVAGFILTTFWYQSHLISEYYMKTWFVDARRIAILDKTGILVNRYLYSLGFKEQFEEKDSLNQLQEIEISSHIPVFEDLKRPLKIASTKTMKYTIIHFFLLWILLTWYMVFTSTSSLI
ncbi:hypothetical protein HQ531_12490 [bacterium]|nr:hypothetical protein [bacterium]